MPIKLRNQLPMILMLTALFWSPTVYGGETSGTPTEIGRRFKALPWLATLEDAPYEIIPYEHIPLLNGIPAQTGYYRIDPDVLRDPRFFPAPEQLAPQP